MNITEMTLAMNRVQNGVRAFMEGRAFSDQITDVGTSINSLVMEIHGRNIEAGWWSDIKTGERRERNVGEMLMLAVSELCEVPNAEEVTQTADDKLPHRLMFEVELADCLVRSLDTAGGTGVPLGKLCAELMHRRAPNIGPWSPQWTDKMLMQPIRSLSDAMEGHRKGNTERFGYGLASAFIGVLMIGVAAPLDLPRAFAEKVEFNANRADHKVENRKADGGKAY